MSERTKIELCGPLTVEVAGRRIETVLPSRQGRLLFAFLVLHRERPVRRDELVAAIWPEQPPADADGALKTLLSRLRRVLGPGILEGRTELCLRLSPEATVDVETAAAAVAKGRAALAAGDPRGACATARAAADITSRGLLPGLDAEWIEQRRRELADLELEALEIIAAAGTVLGGADLSPALRAARTLAERAPFRESGHHLWMEALAQRGDVAEALHVYERLRQRLRDELGTAPSHELAALHERMLRSDPQPGDMARPSGSPAGPPVDAVGAGRGEEWDLPLPAPLAGACHGPFVG
nr:winged helix-turn-helix domain-containing protein [Solirubrobacterales bacterium]